MSANDNPKCKKNIFLHKGGANHWQAIIKKIKFFRILVPAINSPKYKKNLYKVGAGYWQATKKKQFYIFLYTGAG